MALNQNKVRLDLGSERKCKWDVLIIAKFGRRPRKSMN